MNMLEAGLQFEPTRDRPYRVRLPEGDTIIVRTGPFYGSPAAHFTHPNIVAREDKVWEFKHSRRNGSKFWTSRAGIDLYLVLPKAKIEMIDEPGYSWVPVEINGVKITFNVSGGTDGNNGWTDVIRSTACLSVGLTKAKLKALAAVALSPAEVLEQGKGFTLDVQSGHDKAFVELASQHDCLAKKEQLTQLVLTTKTTLGDKVGPYNITGRRGRRFSTTVGSVSYNLIDWPKTAAINGLPPVERTYWNKVGPITGIPAETLNESAKQTA